VPVLGAFVVWFPAAIDLALVGDWSRAAIRAARGAGVVSTIDNVMRPIRGGNRLKLDPVPLFVSFLGGLQLFGAAGLGLGPWWSRSH